MADKLTAPIDTRSQIPFSRPPTPHASPARVGFCGIGAMGRHMARNLARRQGSDVPPLLIYNRTVAKAQSLAEELGKEKIAVALRPEQLVTDCDIIITSLPNDAAVKSVYEVLSQALKNSHYERHKVFVETSTIHPTLSGELYTLMSGPHTHFITSPVLGPPPAADAAQLIIVMAGDVRAKREIAYLFVPAVGKKVIDVGGNVEKAPTLKLLGNSLLIGSIELMGEVMTLADKSGVGIDHVERLMNDIFPIPWWSLYSNKIANDKFDGTKGFHLDGGIKDASHIRSLAATHNSPMPIIDVAHQHMLTARAIHGAQGEEAKYPVLDWSALVAGSRVAAGLSGLESSTVRAIPVQNLS
ncbi:NAD-P-binding protein [Gautieria morchelliformis]|nr:NAD-P-binding protein [Gautieria morchelliformis]